MSSSRRLIALFLILFPIAVQAQVLRDAEAVEQGLFEGALAGTVFIQDDGNLLAGFAQVRYGVTDRITLTLQGGADEHNSLIGGQLDIQIRDEAPLVSISGGAHHRVDLAVDGTVNATWPIQKNTRIYVAFDFDLILDDDPDLPAWAILGTLLPIRPTIDLNLEAGVGLVPIASEVFTAGFVFSL